MIRAEQLNKTYDKKSSHANHVLKDVSVTLPDTGFVCILGPSGCGKTTLLNTLGGLDIFDGGSITVQDVTASRYGTAAMELERNRSFGYIFQNYYLLMERSAAYNVYLGLHSLPLSHEEKLERVREALEAVEMDRYARRNVGELSGGQKQRVAIARALARRPRVIFADEPTGNLDEANTMNIGVLLRQISRFCLVVMVTHEERIARFFADRIITMDNGCLKSDSSEWRRDPLTCGDGQTLYAGDYEEETARTEGLQVRMLREDDAEPIALTVVALKDRIVLKVEDGRSLTMSTAQDGPVIVEGRRPVHTLEELEQSSQKLKLPQGDQAEDYHGISGDSGAARRGGLSPRMLFEEALRLLRGKGKRQLGLWISLVVLTALTVLAVGDYMTVAAIDPEDFIHTDSHLIEINVERGGTGGASVADGFDVYLDYLNDLDMDFTYVPVVGAIASYSDIGFLQMDTLKESVYGFSYIPIDKMDESTLVSGRMPEHPDEIVADRWVLDQFLSGNSVLQASISDAEVFLNKSFSLGKKNITLKIVGICDSGEPSLYLDPFALLSIASAGIESMSLSQLQAYFPGVYDDVILGPDELMTGPKAGVGKKVGNYYTTASLDRFVIAGRVEEDIYAQVVVNDDQADRLQRAIIENVRHFYVYTEDKEAMKQALLDLPEELEGVIQVLVDDYHSSDMAAYEAAAREQLGARSIVTMTILVMSMVMVYLLLKVRVSQRRSMIAVYRLLGIPGRQLIQLFAMETILLSLSSALPAAVATWTVLTAMTKLPSLAFEMILPVGAAAAAYGLLLAFHLAASLLPVGKLLKLPPAVLAARYDI
ncbi:MAG: ABC transporter ATP-binding protein/permease [Lachnospiraceae bacterium]|nr:ABC transporter ATP-binding protein/permease [Lachnospiraceae bacterium]